MFLQLPFQPASSLQQIVLLVNTVLLITTLIVVELVYAEAPEAKRQPLKFFFPLFIVLVGLLLYAVYKQAGV